MDRTAIPLKLALQTAAPVFLAGLLVAAPALAEQGTPTADPDPQVVQEAAQQAEQTSAKKPTLDERLDALLAETLPADEYRETKRCLSRYQYRKIDILSQDYLLFSKNDEYWLNKLKNRCPGLRYDAILTTTPKGTSSLCQGDPVYATSRMDLDRGFDAGGRPLGYQGMCILGEYQSISAEQVALLREVK